MSEFENTDECCEECARESSRRGPILRILIGLPRSGKSTYANNFKGSWVIISADQLRYLVYGQRFWGPGEDMMWSVRKIALKMLMEQGLDIIIDETNTTAVRRSPIIKLAKECGYRIEGIWINTSEEVCIQRAEGEGDILIIPTIKRMAEQFEKPTVKQESATDKGEFDCLYIFDGLRL